MNYFYAPSTGLFYGSIHENIPGDAREVSEQDYRTLVLDRPSDKRVITGPNGDPQLADLESPQVTEADLCMLIDQAADRARTAVAGDPLRAVEYERAALEAQAFADAGYQGNVPPMVAAWAINGRTPQQAADSILGEAAQYNAALVQIRTVRLSAKELVRKQMADGHPSIAKAIADEAVAEILAAVEDVGNNVD